jgi:hypothetical protein
MKQPKTPMLHPNSWSSASTLTIIKEKMGGGWKNNNVTIYKSVAILSSDLTWETSKDHPALKQIPVL